MSQKLTKVMIEQLSKWGVDHIYGYPGDSILKFISELKESPIKFYSTKNESAASLMASAESKLQEKISVCVGDGGPGTANIVNGVADAYSDRTPMLLITGQVESYNIGTNYNQFIKQLNITDSLTVYSAIVSSPEVIVDLMVKAMIEAITKGGVSHLVVPMDMWDQKTNAQPRDYLPHLDEIILPDEELINQAVDLINQAQKPIILYGRGAKECREELLQLSNKINGGLITTLAAQGMIEYQQALYLGGLGHTGNNKADNLLEEADLIIILGATWWPMNYVPREPKVIQFDAIKENIGMNHPVEIGVLANIQDSINLLLEKVSKKENQVWSDKVEGVRELYSNNLSKESKNGGKGICPKESIKAISEYISEDEIICLDSGDSVVWFGRYFSNRCKEVLISGKWRTMGFALPAALAAKINYPNLPVTAIIGDGGIGMVLAELLTAKRYNLAIRIIVFDNSVLAMEKNKMLVSNLEVDEVKLSNPDFIKLSEACGIKGVRVENINDLKKILAESKELKETMLIDIPTSNPIPEGTKL
ncbi:thiamine pyrophosphate-binding protein [Orenia marismortui]|uniref:Pyruvate dehydrogenase (Quinone)/pyruvate oxidase n=1 Tax=Orenia marismortui TaxID=46469 RepID=A0A4R8H602_9FIRM|nr:thiamine pyrophosphate-binding protein [Orenia marismortui]TDX52876.1 pyruvate dehydrogenase (quinone)/pyruvate oxidase [Orenia marismortui]